MTRFQEWQKQKDAEYEASQSDSGVIAILLVLIFSCVALLLLALIFGEDDQNACEELGGAFTVVGEEYSAALKQTIDIYGCVK